MNVTTRSTSTRSLSVTRPRNKILLNHDMASFCETIARSTGSSWWSVFVSRHQKHGNDCRRVKKAMLPRFTTQPSSAISYTLSTAHRNRISAICIGLRSVSVQWTDSRALAHRTQPILAVSAFLFLCSVLVSFGKTEIFKKTIMFRVVHNVAP